MADPQIIVESYKRVDLITISGRIDSSNYPTLEKALTKLMDDGRHNLVLNLKGVSYMSSAGLRVLVATLRKCKKSSGDLRITNPSDRVKEVLDLAGLDSMFQQFDNPTAAVGSF